MLESGEVYRKIKAVDLAAVLPILDACQWVSVSYGSADPNKPPCDVVLGDKFPPALVALYDALGLGGDLGRRILRRLNPDQNIPVHTDAWMPTEMVWRRFQVPIISHPDVKMEWPDDGVRIHLEPGWLYEVQFNRPHAVINPGHTRVHMQIDQVNATI